MPQPFIYLLNILIMGSINEVKEFFDRLCNTDLGVINDIPEISSDDKAKLVKVIDDARFEVKRLRIIDIMKKCK